ncbi:MAG: SRPBCC domain-containing protein [Sterolibacterium sp.]
MYEIVHRIGIIATAAQVFAALASKAGLAQWWTEEVHGEDRVGGKIEFRFSTQDGAHLGSFGMEVKALVPQTEVRWLCVEGPADWLGTEISFQLSEQSGLTIVLFSHKNWPEAVDHRAHCSMKWATFLLSLRQYVETGKGKPSPHDLKIDDWN